MKFFRASWSFLLLLLVTGCNKKKNMVHHGPVSSCEARLVDVPFPLAVTPRELGIIVDDHSNQDVIIEFKTALSRDELGGFYHKEMEQYGWKELSICNAVDEQLLLFEKPFKFCIISIRCKGNNTTIIRYFISQK